MLRELYLDELVRTRTKLLETYHAIADPSLAPEGRWSARHILHHLMLAESSSAKIFRAADRVCTPCEPYDDAALEQERDIQTISFKDRSVRIEAPERTRPEELSADLDVVAELIASRTQLLNYVKTIDDDKMRSLRFTHAIRGDITLFGWLWFIAQHESRHTQQLMELQQLYS